MFSRNTQKGSSLAHSETYTLYLFALHGRLVYSLHIHEVAVQLLIICGRWLAFPLIVQDKDAQYVPNTGIIYAQIK